MSRSVPPSMPSSMPPELLTSMMDALGITTPPMEPGVEVRVATFVIEAGTTSSSGVAERDEQGQPDEDEKEEGDAPLNIAKAKQAILTLMDEASRIFVLQGGATHDRHKVGSVAAMNFVQDFINELWASMTTETKPTSIPSKFKVWYDAFSWDRRRCATSPACLISESAVSIVLKIQQNLFGERAVDQPTFMRQQKDLLDRLGLYACAGCGVDRPHCRAEVPPRMRAPDYKLLS